MLQDCLGGEAKAPKNFGPKEEVEEEGTWRFYNISSVSIN